MERLKEFFKTKGFYIAVGTGVAALATLLLFYNYAGKKSQFRREQALDLNQPADEQLAENVQENNAVKDVASNGVLKKEQSNKNIATNDNSISSQKQDNGLKNEEKSINNIDPTNTDDKKVIDEYMANSSEIKEVAEPVMNYDGGQYLLIPIEGEVAIPYSMDTTVYFPTLDTYRCNPGMLIKAEEGHDVRAAYEGIVEKIEDTKEYGTILTIDMGNGYKAKYGQLMNITVEEGDSVGMAENLGEVAPVSSYYTEEGSHLYFEIDKDGTPINPNGLFKE